MTDLMQATLQDSKAPRFTLPPELEAREPPEARGLTRDEVRLLVSARTTQRIDHARFKDLPRFVRPGDLLVVNASKTLPAALSASREHGDEIIVHLSTHFPGDLWVVEPRHAQVQAGEILTLPDGGSITLLAPYLQSRRLWVARVAVPIPIYDFLTTWGKPIAYSYMQRAWPIDFYQTVYAQEPGSAEMPSAGRAFSWDVLARLLGTGVQLARVILHTGVASLEDDEPLYEEYFRVPPETVAMIGVTRQLGGRVIAVGTTVVRALESATDERGTVYVAQGWTNLVITPERGVRVVEGLLTGFHEPRSTHLKILEAVAGRDHIEDVYREALAQGYLWHEFGDLHLLLP